MSGTAPHAVSWTGQCAAPGGASMSDGLDASGAVDRVRLPQAGGLVLAGGRGRRLGGRDKATLLRADGLRLVDNAVAALRPACPRGITVLRGDHEPLPGMADDLRQVPDPGRGPVGALCVGLESALAQGQHMVLVLAVDVVTPCVPLLARLAQVLVEEDVDVVVPEVDGQLQLLHAAWSTRAAATMERCLERGILRLHDALEALEVEAVGRDLWADLDPTASFVRDVDEPTDLALLEHLAGAGTA